MPTTETGSQLNRPILNSRQKITIYFKRKKVAKYSGYCKPGSKPFLGIDVDPKLSVKHYPALIKWCQSLVDAFAPDYAALSFFANSEEGPWPTTLDEKISRFRRSSTPFPGQYYRIGPPGLGTITWLGSHFIEQFGSQNLDSCSFSTSFKQGWGGRKIVFGNINEPWNVELGEFLDHWTMASNELAKLKVFSQISLDKDFYPRSTKGSNCNIGGVIENYRID